jgi:hypothetical protein
MRTCAAGAARRCVHIAEWGCAAIPPLRAHAPLCSSFTAEFLILAYEPCRPSLRVQRGEAGARLR